MSFEQDPTRNLALELVRVTEAAALAAGRFMGRGDKEEADSATVNAMRIVLQTVDMNGIITISEEKKDNAPTLYNGEEAPKARSTIIEARNLTALDSSSQIIPVAVDDDILRTSSDAFNHGDDMLIPSLVGDLPAKRHAYWAEENVVSLKLDLDIPRSFWCSFYPPCEGSWPVIFAKAQGLDDSQVSKPISPIWVLQRLEMSNISLHIRPP